ncbi:glycosyltransferase [Lactiplantibacillus sp. WILCCON 0030]|uniref:Glycosyltransferase n=1 Tax=Lactiplantibacillus brownii TaxID=3069269 RepID=A0ABU1AA30_9LACO|nr:glycosyltransferase [Lactiplantibacillus brownii]MDQ7937738.1 glycosyltransferase [Lactiplantibacillus brownii]
MTKVKHAFLVVIYNRPASNCVALTAVLENLNDSQKLVIYDNSVQSQMDIKLPETVVYKHDSRNKGLFTAYNYAVDLCRDLKIKWLTIFDQDTCIPSAYFKILNEKLTHQANGVGCIVPNVYIEKGKKISPFIIENNLFLFNKNSNKTLGAINSGCTININAFDNTRIFSPSFPLDFLDYDFFWKLKRNNLKVSCIHINLVQELSVSDYKTMTDRRFCSFICSERKFIMKRYPQMLLQYKLKMIVRLLNMVLKNVQISKIKFAVKALRGKCV